MSGKGPLNKKKNRLRQGGTGKEQMLRKEDGNRHEQRSWKEQLARSVQNRKDKKGKKISKASQK